MQTTNTISLVQFKVVLIIMNEQVLKNYSPKKKKRFPHCSFDHHHFAGELVIKTESISAHYKVMLVVLALVRSSPHQPHFYFCSLKVSTVLFYNLNILHLLFYNCCLMQMALAGKGSFLINEQASLIWFYCEPPTLNAQAIYSPRIASITRLPFQRLVHAIPSFYHNTPMRSICCSTLTRQRGWLHRGGQ